MQCCGCDDLRCNRLTLARFQCFCTCWHQLFGINRSFVFSIDRVDACSRVAVGTNAAGHRAVSAEVCACHIGDPQSLLPSCVASRNRFATKTASPAALVLARNRVTVKQAGDSNVGFGRTLLSPSETRAEGSLLVISSGQESRSDPCISSVTTAIMITTSNSSAKRSGMPNQ